ncbi:MAG: cell division protein SepF [Bacillota bacterium]|nr:cell division protein SepF [Bacillota bacterium]
MSMWDRMLNFLGLEEDLSDEDEVIREEGLRPAVAEAAVEKPRGQSLKGAPAEARRYGSLISLAGGQGRAMNVRVVIWRPESFDEVQSMVDRLREGAQLLVNLEGVDRALSQRLVNFLSGSVYALGGSMQKVSGHVMVFAPQGVQIDMAQGYPWEAEDGD